MASYRQPSFMTFNGVPDEDRPAASGVRSRLPASPENPSSNLIDLTPSGEVQMRVTRGQNVSHETTPKQHNASTEATTYTQENTNRDRDIDRLREELEEH